MIEKTNKKLAIIFATILAVTIIATAMLVSYHYETQTDLRLYGGANLGLKGTDVPQVPYEVHTVIRIYKAGVKILEEYHAGVVTNLGLNTTFGKLTNNAFYNASTYSLNLGYVGIGNQGTLTAASTVLPGEWNRTAGTPHTPTYNSINWTTVIYPDAGPYTADCLGVYYEAAGNSLFLYDTFTEVTGIDDTFTITLEIILSATGS